MGVPFLWAAARPQGRVPYLPAFDAEFCGGVAIAFGPLCEGAPPAGGGGEKRARTATFPAPNRIFFVKTLQLSRHRATILVTMLNP